jgi:hypothetical protein
MIVMPFLFVLGSAAVYLLPYGCGLWRMQWSQRKQKVRDPELAYRILTTRKGRPNCSAVCVERKAHCINVHVLYYLAGVHAMLHLFVVFFSLWCYLFPYSN